MSDDSPERERIEQERESIGNATPEAEKSSRKPLFGSLNKDLRQALDTWDTLTEQMNHKMSPEEEQLREVKKLLGELKSKLSQFDD